MAFETSCDETSVAVLKNDTELLSNVIASQIESHKRFGGVVPEVASRHHVEVITACIEEALEEAGITEEEVTAVAVTYGPGLVGALLVGLAAAKAFAWAHGIPLIPVNHMAGHLMAAQSVEPLEFPLLALLVSGGHTELVYVSEAGDYKIVGETRETIWSSHSQGSNQPLSISTTMPSKKARACPRKTYRPPSKQR